MMMKQQIFGINKLVFQKIAFSEEVWQIISGQWEFRVLAGRVLKSILIEAALMAKRADQLLMKIGILKFGI